MSTFTEILNAALTLPLDQRNELAEVLWESMDEPTVELPQQPEMSQAWKDEIARRSAAYDRGELKSIPWEQVREEVRRKYHRHA